MIGPQTDSPPPLEASVAYNPTAYVHVASARGVSAYTPHHTPVRALEHYCYCP